MGLIRRYIQLLTSAGYLRPAPGTIVQSRFPRAWWFAIAASVMFTGHLSAQQSQVTPAASGTAASPVPHLIRFTGTLLDRQGQPLKGPVAVTFSLYAQQSGDAPLWMETQNVELDAKGGYTALLGANSGTDLPEELFRNGEARWLGVQPEREPEQPRVLLVSVPYALKAGDAQTLGGLPPSAFAPASLAAATNSSSSTPQPALLASPGATSAATAPLTTSFPVTTAGGTTNFIPLWSSGTPSTTLKNSILFQSSASNVNVNGSFSLSAVNTATATAGSNSQPLDLFSSVFSSSTHAAVSQHFRWQAEPVGNNTSSPSAKLNLLFAPGAATPAETGFSISSKGIVSAKQLVSSALVSAGSTMMLGGTGVNVGIGTSTPTERLDLGNAGNVVIKTDPGNDTTPGDVAYKLIGRAVGGGTNTWAIFTAPVGGGFGIPVNSLSIWQYQSSGSPGCCMERFTILPANGVTGPNIVPSPVIIDAGGNLRVLAVLASFVQATGDISTDSDMSATGCVIASGFPIGGTCKSDARLKKNMQPFSPVLDKLIQLQPVSYNWRAEEFPQFHFGTSRTSGLIAQEVEKVFPEMVSVDKDGFNRVNYSGLPLLMLQAIRELKAEKDKLQEELKTKEAQWEERFRAQEERTSLQQKQQAAALEARLARLEREGGSNQAAAATREAPKRNTAAVD
ncbi:MAG TPA: tail fiber domain-containing protein [Candidatus Dormibacteraeota bacterium]|nr:tail fiber domain-containing protein [Candidatus Dormibacteraeota bacterium]